MQAPEAALRTIVAVEHGIHDWACSAVVDVILLGVYIIHLWDEQDQGRCCGAVTQPSLRLT